MGKLGTILFKKGFYVYAGRYGQPFKTHRETQKAEKNLSLAIDFLRDSADFTSALAIRSSDRLECEIADSLSKIAQWSVRGFGSSDCTCGTHLFGFTNNPINLPSFQKLLQYFRMDRYGGEKNWTGENGGKRSEK